MICVFDILYLIFDFSEALMLTKRKKKVLKRIIEEYIRKAKPVSSALIAKRGFPKLSPATIRNEMYDLTKQGLLCQPHTSAGRIPTLQGFKFFLDNFLEEKSVSFSEKNVFLEIKNRYQEPRKKIKELAKELAELSQEAVVVAFSKDDFYYTGLSHLFHQPEFQNISLIYSLSEVIDHLDETMRNIFDKIEKTEILIGEENPFGNQCTTIIDKIELENQKILLSLLGPLRMDYNKNLTLIKAIKKIIG